MNTSEISKKRIALFASGTGSNVLNVISHFKESKTVEVSIVLSNREFAGALNHAKNANIKAVVFDRKDFFESNVVLGLLKTEQIDYLILAGFLWKIPNNILSSFENRILNIHPSLLPKYGGKGMYGQNVHQAVLANKEKETGITIHLVNENYDEGQIIKQAKCMLDKDETLISLQKKISKLEKANFPITIEKYITQK